jgi:O-antigen/teichoic acid export membrane protein
MLEKDIFNAKKVVIVSFIVTISVSIIAFFILVIIVFGFDITSLNKIKFVYILLPLYVLFTGVNSSFSFWNNRNKQYKVISKGRVVSAIVTGVSQVVMAFIFRSSPFFLLFGLVLGQFCLFIYLFFSTPDLYKNLIKNFSFLDIKYFGYKYKNFFIFSSFSDLLNIFLVQLPVFILTRLVGAAPTGQFAFSNRLLAMPISFFSSSVGEVFKQHAIDEYNKNGVCSGIFLKTFKGLFLFSVFPFILLFIFASDIFAFVFGEVWREAGVFTRIMIPMFFFKFTVSPLTYIYYINERQIEDFILHIMMLILIVCSLYFGFYWFKDVRMMLLLYSVCFSSIYIYYFVRSYILSKRKINNLEKTNEN